ncbi:cobyric acid synthase [uncultured Ilyobacter sp.]|uniref:cobyric acid synthase n=1 Tax=uncultured Ilyobacter sp. TaxID=544433 RepID=UPI0029C0C48B|nr:cobyric acid synthase [uncultured Ilyobacter sp.]
MHKKIMIQGTGSSVGKSLVTAGLCRIFYKDGYKVSPFKSQNMALNSFVDEEGLELGRAQVVQAEMGGEKPRAYMNPILLKPNADDHSQVIFMGKPCGNVTAVEYFSQTEKLRKVALEGYDKIRKNYDLCVLEGGGSPAEINLREVDVVNMGMAELVDAPVVLVSDIERGGVFAQIYGTIMLLDKNDRDRIKGIIINKFRGNKEILDPGIEMIKKKLKEDGVDIPILGVLPHLDVKIEEEDVLAKKLTAKKTKNDITISVIRTPKMSNYTDFDVFEFYDDVALNYVDSPEDIGEEDMIIIPGSKNTIGDLIFIKESGIYKKITEEAQKGKLIFGICGGFQILGSKIMDPLCIETPLGEEDGLGLLNVTTTMGEEKATYQVEKKLINCKGILTGLEGASVKGYEIHQGQTEGKEELFLEGDLYVGVYRENIMATYLHGIFDNGIFTRHILNYLRREKGLKENENLIDYEKVKNMEFDKWEEHLRKNLDIDKIYEILK